MRVNLDGTAALVTGTADEIGQAIVGALALNGASVVDEAAPVKARIAKCSGPIINIASIAGLDRSESTTPC